MQLIQTKSSFIAPLGGARRVAVVSNATERRLSMKGKQSYQVDVRDTFRTYRWIRE